MHFIFYDLKYQKFFEDPFKSYQYVFHFPFKIIPVDRGKHVSVE